MSKYLSPGNYFVEVDISDYPPSINSSVAGVVGFASKGPVAGKNGDKATLITSQENLIRTFGEPSETIAGQAIEGALEILESTNSLYFIRCAEGDEYATTNVKAGFCPSLLVSSNLLMAPAPAGSDGLGSGMLGNSIGCADEGVSAVKLTITSYDNVGNKTMDSKEFVIPRGTVNTSSTGATSYDALKKVIGGSLDADKVGVFGNDTSAFIVGLAAGENCTVSAAMQVNEALDGTTTGAWIYPNEGLQAVSADGSRFEDTADSQVQAFGGTFTNLNYYTRSLYPGAGYNEGTTPTGDTSGNSFEVDTNGGQNSITEVNDRGVALETYKGGTTSSVFLESIIGKTSDSATSEFILGYFTSALGNYPLTSITPLDLFHSPAFLIAPENYSAEGTVTANENYTTVSCTYAGTETLRNRANARFVKLVQGTYSLEGGDNGIPNAGPEQEAAIIGKYEEDGGKTGIEGLDAEGLDIKMALIPDMSEYDGAQNALITKAETAQSFLALVSPPLGVGRTTDAIDWSNGQDDDRSAAINSSYAAVYWPWVKTFSVFDGKDRWLAPEIYAARQMCFTDGVSRPWFAPAGLQRGRLTKPVDVEVSLNQGDRDSLYSGGNIINPIVKFAQDGIVIFGQRTAQRVATALDRINVRRLLIDLRDTIIRATRQFAFEPNDRFTWDQVENVVAPLLDQIKRERGINEFKVVCDETTNTPLRIDRNELWCKVLLKPTKTAEMVVFEVNVTNQSAKIGE